MNAVPAGAECRSEGGEVNMEFTVVRGIDRRLQLWVPLALAFGFILVALIPLAVGGGNAP